MKTRIAYCYCGLLTIFLLVGTTQIRAASVPELNAKARISEEAGLKAGYKPEAVMPPTNAYIPSAKELAKGVVLFQPPIERPFRGAAPSREEVGGNVDMQGARGTSESVLLGVHALQTMSGMTLRVQTASLDKAIEIEILPVIMAPLSQGKKTSTVGVMGDSKGAQVFTKVGLWLADNGPVSIGKGESLAWVLRVNIGAKAPAGTFRVPVEWVGPEGGNLVATTTLQVNVLPFELVDAWDSGYRFGVFYGGLPSTEVQFRQLKAHGIDSIQWFWNHSWGADFTNQGGKLKINFDGMDAMVEKFTKAGMRGPLVISQTGTVDSFYNALCKVMNRDPGNLDDSGTYAILVEGWRQLFEHAAAKNWPEIVVLPNDEPTTRSTRASRLARHHRTVKIMREHFPKIRVYGVCMDKIENAKLISDVDIFVCNGDWDKIVSFAKENNKTVWFYGSCTAARSYESVRQRYGLPPYSHGGRGMFFWSINYTMGDPFNEFDGDRPDSAWNMVWPPLKKNGPLVEDVAFEGLRAGVNDVRYAMTLEKLMQTRTGEMVGKIAANYRELQKSNMQKSESIPACRAKIIEWILQLNGR